MKQQLNEVRRMQQLAGISKKGSIKEVEFNTKTDSNMSIDSYDDAIEVFRQLVVPKYSLDQIPAESVEDLESEIMDFFKAGEIKTVDDMIEKVDDAIKLGFTKSLYYKK